MVVDYKKKYELEHRLRLVAAKKHKAKMKREVSKALYTKSPVFKARNLREQGLTWKQISKKMRIPESTIRLKTQKHFSKEGKVNPVLRGKLTEVKQRAMLKMHERIDAMIRNHETSATSYEEYIRQSY